LSSAPEVFGVTIDRVKEEACLTTGFFSTQSTNDKSQMEIGKWKAITPQNICARA